MTLSTIAGNSLTYGNGLNFTSEVKGECSMDSGLFNVALEGKLKEGVDPKEAGDNLAKSFRLNPDKIGPLLAGNPVVVKRGVGLAVADKYREALEQMGFEARIEKQPPPDRPLDSSPGKTVENLEIEPESLTGTFRCPKCGYEKRIDGDFISPDECPKCGVIISKCSELLKENAPESTNLIKTDVQSTKSEAAEVLTIEFPEHGLLRVFSALEFTLPGSLELPLSDGQARPAAMRTRFFAALASLCIMLYGTFVFQIPIALVLLLMFMTGNASRITMGDAQGFKVLAWYVCIALSIHLSSCPMEWADIRAAVDGYMGSPEGSM
jgi:predicted RNA-binding Zn-ribbon protein involved in translation (DUF1610 family)